MFPLYLTEKLGVIGVKSHEELINLGYLKTFHYIRLSHPSMGFQALFDLYCIYSNITIGSLDENQKNNLIKEYNKLPPSYLPLAQNHIGHFMQLALEQAIIAKSKNEIPIGAVIVKDGQIIAHGYNQTLSSQKITQHAEVVAIEHATKIIGSHRLNGCDLYVTVEPCLMCSGAIIHSRISRLIFGSSENKTGSILSQYNVFSNLNVNHHTEVIGPINQDLYLKPLQDFLDNRRSKNKHNP